LLVGCGPRPASGPAPVVADLVAQDVSTACRAAVTALLRTELEQMARGLPNRYGDPLAALARAYGPGSPVLLRAQQVNDLLLVTAAGDLLGPYRRDVEALVRSYAPRIAADCAAG
jgi:hypothetical protein